MEENPIRWFEIYVQDMERAKAFYSTLFDYQFTKLDAGDVEMWAFTSAMDKGGAAQAGGRVFRPKCRSGRTVLSRCFTTPKAI